MQETFKVTVYYKRKHKFLPKKKKEKEKENIIIYLFIFLRDAQ